jgi:hypothetical protein
MNWTPLHDAFKSCFRRLCSPKKGKSMQKPLSCGCVKHDAARKTYIAKHVMLLFALMEVYLICQQHQHNQAEFPLWFSKRAQTAAAAEKPNTAT